LKNRILELETSRMELFEKIEQNKEKARVYLMQKDLQSERLKMILFKVEACLKSNYGLT
jgi:hypothetical protein